MVSGRALAVEEPGLGEDESAVAHRHRHRRVLVGRAQPVQGLGGEVLETHRGNDNDVRAGGSAEVIVRHDGHPAGDPDRLRAGRDGVELEGLAPAIPDQDVFEDAPGSGEVDELRARSDQERDPDGAGFGLFQRQRQARIGHRLTAHERVAPVCRCGVMVAHEGTPMQIGKCREETLVTK